jgi:RNA polymerase sigma factor (sigma-70 family)
MTDCRQLLANYADNGSETAFRELVSRYIDLVYSTARRLLNGDAHLAEDVTQTVFADLARKAPTLSKDILLGGWLHRHTCYMAANVLRRERRRQAREQEIVRMNVPEYDPNDTAAQLAPVLDEAINELSASDRAAILLRFFEQHDLRAVGDALGSSEDAAQKRVGRALEKLRVILVRRGVALPGATLATALAAQAVTAAPAGLAASVSTAAVAGVAAGTATAFTLINIMTMTKLKGAVLGAILVATGSTLVLQQQSKAKLRDENLSLLRKYEEFTGLQAENARLSNQLVNARQAESMSRDQLSELLRLRGEVALARNQKAELETTREENRRFRSAGAVPAAQEAVPAQDDFPKAAWSFAGYATPEAAFQSTVWAISHGDVKTMLASMTPEERTRKLERWQGQTEEEIAAKNRTEFEQIKGFRILKKESLSDDEVVLTLYVEGLSPNEPTPRMKLLRIGTEWKTAGPERDGSK